MQFQHICPRYSIRDFESFIGPRSMLPPIDVFRVLTRRGLLLFCSRTSAMSSDVSFDRSWRRNLFARFISWTEFGPCSPHFLVFSYASVEAARHLKLFPVPTHYIDRFWRVVPCHEQRRISQNYRLSGSRWELNLCIAQFHETFVNAHTCILSFSAAFHTNNCRLGIIVLCELPKMV